MKLPTSSRQLAQRILLSWERARGGIYAETLISRTVGQPGLAERDRPLLNALVHGVLRHRTLLDTWIESLSDKENRRIPDDLRQALRIGLFQLLIQGAPAHAAVHSCVSLARRPLRGFANALLRRADRERERLLAEAQAKPWSERFSHPGFLIDRWVRHFGEPSTEALLRWNNTPATNFIRLPDLSFREQEGAIDREALSRGDIYIQDPSTAIAPKLLDPKPGERILDACAAPGGKTLFLAALAGYGAEIVATDASDERIATLRENLDRRPETREIPSLQHDWAGGAHPNLGLFDAILIDAPCSNTGVLRRRVDARWRITPETFAEFAALQAAILSAACTHLKPGGRMVYSTCSIDPDENGSVVEEFLRRRPGRFALRASRSATPQSDGHDGAYAALIS